MKLRVLSYNVHKFKHYALRRYSIDKLREMIRKLDLDIVFLQEITGHHPLKLRRNFGMAPLEHLADEVWPHFAYGKNAVYPAVSHGNAILSKFPIKKWKNVDISNHRLEQRGLLLSEVLIPS